MRHFNRYATAALTLAVGLAAIGCGKSEPLPGPKPFPVTGTVTYDGKPAADFRVIFHPVKEFDGPQFSPSAMTDAEGKFALHSYAKEDSDGAPAGEYVVTFQWPTLVSSGDDGDAPIEKDRLRGKFANPKRSKWRVQVVAGDNDLETFVLK